MQVTIIHILKIEMTGETQERLRGQWYKRNRAKSE